MHKLALATDLLEKDVIAVHMHCVYWRLSRSAVVGQPDGYQQWQYGDLKVVSSGK